MIAEIRPGSSSGVSGWFATMGDNLYFAGNDGTNGPQLWTYPCVKSNSTDIINACGSYTWIDANTYTSSNNSATYTIVGAAANGCDSVVMLNLTINNSTIGTDVQTVVVIHG